MSPRATRSVLQRMLLPFCLLLSSSLSLAQETPPPAAPAAPQAPQAPSYVQKPELYPLATCVVSGEALDADATVFVAGGRTFRTCCSKCRAKVEKDPDPFVQKLDAASIANQVGHYPLDTCVVSGKKLGSMGEPVQLLFDGTLVQLCCKGCTKRATASSAAMVQKVRDAAFAAQAKTYPLKTCVVSGEPLGDDAVQVLFGTTLVRFCCEKCVRTFEQAPATYLEKLHPEPKPADTPKDGSPGKDA